MLDAAGTRALALAATDTGSRIMVGFNIRP
jgi:hypothetical protein